MEGSRLSFIIRATYDVLPTPKNLNQWFGEDPSHSLCQTPATLRHSLTACKTQGRYTWRHNQVLRQLAITLEGRRTTTNALPLSTPGFSNTTSFVKAGQLPEKPLARKEPTHPDTAHRIPHAMRDRVQSELNRMMALGVITPVTEALEWVSSMLVATKKNKGEIRICINPKDLNTAIKRPRYPMHLVGEITAQMADANVLTVLDAKSSFCQILLEHKSSKLTPFSTPFGRYKCLRMPFGISSAS